MISLRLMGCFGLPDPFLIRGCVHGIGWNSSIICSSVSPFIHQQKKVRLSLSSSLFDRSNRSHRLRTENLHRSIKKNHQKFLKMKKVGAKTRFRKFLVEIFRKFLDFKIWQIENLENFVDFSIVIFEIFEIFKFSNFGIRKNSIFFRPFFSKSTFCSNFFHFQYFLMIF